MRPAALALLPACSPGEPVTPRDGDGGPVRDGPRQARRLDLAEDTVVVFASDNGFFLGDHRRAHKRLAYEESISGSPSSWRYPRLGLAGTHVDGMVLNIDLAPTLLGFAGIEAPASMQGRDLAPLLDGSAAEVRSEFLYEYFFERNYDSPTIVALRRERDVLVTYPGHPAWAELFDLDADPHQVENLAQAAGSAALLQELQGGLAAAKAATGYVVPPTAHDPP